MSGSNFNKTWAINPRDKRGERLARALGWKGKSGNEREILEFLEDVPAFELDDATKTLLSDEEMYAHGLLLAFGPVLEPYESDNCFIYKDPVEMAREAWSNEIDIIVTGVSFEGLLRAFVEEAKAAKFLQNPAYFAPLREFGLSPSDEKSEALGERIKKLYYKNGESPSVENQEQYLRVRIYN